MPQVSSAACRSRRLAFMCSPRRPGGRHDPPRRRLRSDRFLFQSGVPLVTVKLATWSCAVRRARRQSGRATLKRSILNEGWAERQRGQLRKTAGGLIEDRAYQPTSRILPMDHRRGDFLNRRRWCAFGGGGHVIPMAPVPFDTRLIIFLLLRAASDLERRGLPRQGLP